MNQTFKIQSKGEVVTSPKGTKWVRAVVVNTETSKEFANTTLFDPFATQEIGSTITGILTSNDYNGKSGWKFVGEKTQVRRSPTAINQAMEKKAQNIEKAQENRAEGVKIASTFRDATLITVSLMNQRPFPTEKEIQDKWLEWRGWLWKHWEDEQEPF